MAAKGQSPCLPGGIIFTTQTLIDDFQTNYFGCTEIDGDVYTGDWVNPSNITNLDGLNTVNAIGGYLDLTNNPQLTSLEGLGNLVSIGGYLNLLWNNGLTDMTGLENL